MPHSMSWLPIRWSNSCLSRQGFCHHWGVKCQSRFPRSLWACQCLGCSLQIRQHYQSGVKAVIVRDHILPGPHCTTARCTHKVSQLLSNNFILTLNYWKELPRLRKHKKNIVFTLLSTIITKDKTMSLKKKHEAVLLLLLLLQIILMTIIDY